MRSPGRQEAPFRRRRGRCLRSAASPRALRPVSMHPSKELRAFVPIGINIARIRLRRRRHRAAPPSGPRTPILTHGKPTADTRVPARDLAHVMPTPASGHLKRAATLQMHQPLVGAPYHLATTLAVGRPSDRSSWGDGPTRRLHRAVLGPELVHTHVRNKLRTRPHHPALRQGCARALMRLAKRPATLTPVRLHRRLFHRRVDVEGHAKLADISLPA